MTRQRKEIVTPAWRAKLADPKPPFCAACLRGADAQTAFIDLGMPIERGEVREHGSMAIVAVLDRCCLCESCVREMAECLEFRPQTHREHMQVVGELNAECERLTAENEMLRGLVGERMTVGAGSE